jgi:hypothetical protein
MKDAEDEAFEAIERRQGAGGFHAKQDMAMHKTQDQHICRHYKQWQHCHICDLESQAAELANIKAILDEYGLQAIDFVADFKAALAQPAQEPVAWVWKDIRGQGLFEPQLDSVPLYTTPPQREWVGLTEKDFSAINQSCLTKLQAATSAESILKERNS